MKKNTQTFWFLNMKNKKDAIINAVLLVAIVIVYGYITNFIFDFYSPEATSNTQDNLKPYHLNYLFHPYQLRYQLVQHNNFLPVQNSYKLI